MQKIVLVDEQGQSRLVQGDADEARMRKGDADAKVLPILLADGWTIDSSVASNAAFLLVLKK